MIRCPFCDHKNPAGAKHCAECKAELFVSAEDAADAANSARTDLQSLDGRVIALLREGRKIEAIKLYRDLTGAGLKEAKDAVEALERDGTSSESRIESADSDRDVLNLLRAGQKIRAIKLYREKTGVGLADAKKAVEALASAEGIPAGSSGCAGAVLTLLFLVTAFRYLLS